MNAMPASIEALQTYILEHIPLARAMAIEARHWDGSTLELAAPLAPNINDKDCAFGGSLSSLMTLAGWGASVLALAAHEIESDVFVARSETRYLVPLYGELVAHARAPAAEELAQAVAALKARGRARLRIEAAIVTHAGDAATQNADFAARMRSA